jgi:Asp-tRNA(Asn)/Glu-tRNA(Gln) amidotransferase C subunit
MRSLTEETLKRVDEELAGIGFSADELKEIRPQVAWLMEEAEALEEIDLADVEPCLTYSLEIE